MNALRDSMGYASMVDVWKDVDTDTVSVTPTATGRWKDVGTETFTVTSAISRWKDVATETFTIIPSPTRWKPVATSEFIINPPEPSPPPPEFRWEWLLIGGGVALATGMLLAKKQPPEKRT